jgi:hypothetical protein
MTGDRHNLSMSYIKRSSINLCAHACTETTTSNLENVVCAPVLDRLMMQPGHLPTLCGCLPFLFLPLLLVILDERFANEILHQWCANHTLGMLFWCVYN